MVPTTDCLPACMSNCFSVSFFFYFYSHQSLGVCMLDVVVIAAWRRPMRRLFVLCCHFCHMFLFQEVLRVYWPSDVDNFVSFFCCDKCDKIEFLYSSAVELWFKFYFSTTMKEIFYEMYNLLLGDFHQDEHKNDIQRIHLYKFSNELLKYENPFLPDTRFNCRT